MYFLSLYTKNLIKIMKEKKVINLQFAINIMNVPLFEMYHLFVALISDASKNNFYFLLSYNNRC